MNAETREHIHLIDDDAAVRDSLGLLLEQAGFSLLSFASAEDFLEAEPDVDAVCAEIGRAHD